MKSLIIYWSGTGNTKGMADGIAQGIESANGKCDVFFAQDFAGNLDGYDKILLGCPAMGGEVLEEDVFEPLWQSIKSKLSGKVVGLFGSYGWGDGEWMRNWVQDAKDSGILLIDDGFIRQENEDGIFESCFNYGKSLC